MFLGRRLFHTIHRVQRFAPMLSYRPMRMFADPGPTIDIQQELNKQAIEQMSFQTETQQLLEIVAKSLYKDKEVFIRELVSNSCDALEKQRYMSVTGSGDTTGEELRISITTNENDNTITIFDSGIGMTRDDMIQNLGTIARSGSKNFLNEIGKSDQESRKTSDSIIGQFGVGFYSTFIVGKEVRVLSKTGDCEQGHSWISNGIGSFEISDVDCDEFTRGTKVTIELKEGSDQYSRASDVTNIIKKYSNFLPFPITLNGTKINTLDAIWSQPKNQITDEAYAAFYEHLSNTKLPAKYKLHFSIDVPLMVNALMYIPNSHGEKFGMGVENTGVSLYSKKVLIQQNCAELLPSWLRFVKGVVDCEDIPLNISREVFQDSALISRLRHIVTTRVIRLLLSESEKNDREYNHWIEEFGQFVKEGMATDQEYSRELAPLARFWVSGTEDVISLPQYIDMMKEGQKNIYYLFSPNKEAAEHSPYMDAFKPKGIPVLYSHHHVDEMIFRQMNDYKGHKFVNIEQSLEGLEKDQVSTTEYDENKGVPEHDLNPFTEWVANELGSKVKKVIISHRLVEAPAMVVGEMSSAMRQVMRLMDKEKEADAQVTSQTLEINPNHEIMKNLNDIRKVNAGLASDVIRQVFDNSLIQAGIIEDANPMITRINRLLKHSLNLEMKNSENK